MSQTTQQWWDSIKGDTEKFNHWLCKQHRGEATASHRIIDFADTYASDDVNYHVLMRIAKQEEQHAEWVLGLLRARGIEPVLDGSEERYWRATLPDMVSFSSGAAVAAHAEKMRLERIRCIVDDVDAPIDVRDVFTRILKDELFHETAFRAMAGPEALAATHASHVAGLESLGLVM